MTQAQYLDMQRIHAIKAPSATDLAKLRGYWTQCANESMPAPPRGTNGPNCTAPDKCALVGP